MQNGGTKIRVTPGTWAGTKEKTVDAMVDDLPAMTGAEMQTTREFLGLTRGWLANDLQMGERRMMRMEAGQESIPDALVARLDDVAAHTKDVVTNMIATYRRAVKRNPGEDVFLQTYKSDEAFALAPDWPGYPAKWHRMCCARVSEAVPGIILTYQPVEDDAAVEVPFSEAG